MCCKRNRLIGTDNPYPAPDRKLRVGASMVAAFQNAGNHPYRLPGQHEGSFDCKVQAVRCTPNVNPTRPGLASRARNAASESAEEFAGLPAGSNQLFGSSVNPTDLVGATTKSSPPLRHRSLPFWLVISRCTKVSVFGGVGTNTGGLPTPSMP